MHRLAIALVVLLGPALTVGLPGTANAAANEFGNGCVATAAPPTATAVMTNGSPANPLPVAAPSTGVITKARVSLPTFPGTIAVVVKVLRAAGAPNAYTVTGQSAVINVGSGTQTYDVRIPVAAGDLLGTGGSGALYCSTANAGDIVGLANGDSAVGSTTTYMPTPSTALPVVASVEPDADHDGYGDVTQDLCPQSAAFQTACPVIKLDTFAATQRGQVTVLVVSNNLTDVKVAGQATVNGKKVKLKGGKQTVKPGALARFKVRIPASLRTALAELSPRQSIRVTFTASAKDVLGKRSKDKASVRLPGTGH
jgi:hypothetical protein